MFLGIDTWTNMRVTFSQLQTGGSFKHTMEQLPESDCFLYDKCRFKINYSVISEVTDTRILCSSHFSDSDACLLHNAEVTGEDCSFSYSAGSTFPRDAPASHHALLRLFSSCLLTFFSSKSGVAVLTQDYHTWWHCVKHIPKGQMSHFTVPDYSTEVYGLWIS